MQRKDYNSNIRLTSVYIGIRVSLLYQLMQKKDYNTYLWFTCVCISIMVCILPLKHFCSYLILRQVYFRLFILISWLNLNNTGNEQRFVTIFFLTNINSSIFHLIERGLEGYNAFVKECSATDNHEICSNCQISFLLTSSYRV